MGDDRFNTFINILYFCNSLFWHCLITLNFAIVFCYILDRCVLNTKCSCRFIVKTTLWMCVIAHRGMGRKQGCKKEQKMWLQHQSHLMRMSYTHARSLVTEWKSFAMGGGQKMMITSSSMGHCYYIIRNIRVSCLFPNLWHDCSFQLMSGI